jgi:hypothetical protein
VISGATGEILINTDNKSHLPLGPELLEFLANYNPEVRAIALKLRELVLEIVPEAIEQVDRPGKLIGYGFKPTYKDTICVIMPLKAAVNLGFPRGTELPDPGGLLVGTGKRARHVKITALEEIDLPRLRALIEASVALTRKGI